MPTMSSPLFDLDRTDLQLTVNEFKPGLGLAWRSLFPLKYTPKFDLKGLEGNEGIPVSADRVAFNTKAKNKTRKKIGSWSGHLGKISVSRRKDEIECQEYKDLTAIAAANPNDAATAKYLVDLVYDDVKFCNTAMDYRAEIEAMMVGSNGKRVFNTTVDGDMATEDTIDFNVPSDQFIGAKSYVWSDAENADGIGDIVRGVNIIKKKGATKPAWAIMAQDAFDYLCVQKKTANRVASAFAISTGIDVTTEITLTQINTYMRNHSYPQILVIDPYVTIEADDGTPTVVRPWNINTVALSPVPQLGYTYYKPVALVDNTDAVQVQSSYYKLTVYSDVNPPSETTLAEAYIQPGLINRASLLYLNSMAKTWNDGAAS